MANQQTLQGNWNEIAGKIRSKWGQLTSDDLQRFKGDSDQLIGLIQRKTGEARDKIEQFLEETSASTAGGIGAVLETARDYANQAMESLGTNADVVRENADKVVERVKEGYENAGKMVQQRPAESMAVAFGAGLVAGVLIVLMLKSE